MSSVLERLEQDTLFEWMCRACLWTYIDTRFVCKVIVLRLILDFELT